MHLIVCDSINELNLIIQKWGKSIKTDFLIFTTNIRFYHLYSHEYKIKLFESKYPVLVEETTLILKEFNEFIRMVIKKKNYVYEVGYSVEGSGIEQNIADILNTTKVCMDFFNQYKFKSIFLCYNKNNALLIEVFREIAKSYRLKIKVCTLSVLKINQLKNRIEYSSGIGIKCFKYIYYLGKGIYTYFKLLLTIVVNFKARFSEVQYWDVGKIQFSNAAKHFFWSIHYIKILNRNLKLNNICIHTDEMKERLLKEGLRTTDFGKSYVYFSYYCVSVVSYYYNIIKIWYKLRLIRVIREEVDISKIIKHRMWQHLLLTVPKVIDLDCKAKGYFEKNKFKIIESMLGGNTSCTRVFYYHTRKEKTVFYRIHNHGRAPITSPLFYECEAEIIQLRFFTEIERQVTYEWYNKMGWKGNALLLEGSILTREEVNKTSTVKEENEKCCILWAPSYPVLGYYIPSIFYKVNEIIVNEFARMDINLLVKYHWNQDESMVKEIKDSYQAKANVKFIDRTQSIEECMKKADIVITTLSTVIFDAILASRPVVIISEGHTIIMNKKLELQEFENVEEAVEFTKKLIHDKNKREMIHAYQKEKMEDFSRRCNKDVCQDIVSELEKFIK